jgi:hypothetical protein
VHGIQLAVTGFVDGMYGPIGFPKRRKRLSKYEIVGRGAIGKHDCRSLGVEVSVQNELITLSVTSHCLRAVVLLINRVLVEQARVERRAQ